MDMIKRARPVLKYYGGKWRQVPKLLALLPPHARYLEPYGGAGSVILRKNPSACDVYNDINGDVVNLFRVLRDPVDGPRLLRSLELTPYARAEYDLSHEPTDDPVEWARRVLVRSTMGMHGYMPNRQAGWRVTALKDAPAEFAGKSEALDWVIQRMKGIYIENMDAIECIRKYDGPDCVIYCDPPYVHGTRTVTDSYDGEMTDADHVALAGVLRTCKGRPLISGYESDLYEGLYWDWDKYYLRGVDSARNQTQEVVWVRRG